MIDPGADLIPHVVKGLWISLELGAVLWVFDFCPATTFHRAQRGKRTAAATLVSPPDEVRQPVRIYTVRLATSGFRHRPAWPLPGVSRRI